jgi:hypothetical protein
MNYAIVHVGNALAVVVVAAVRVTDSVSYSGVV